MTAKTSARASGAPRFDVEALREAAGAKVFARGQEHVSGGSVEIVAIDARRVVARVAGEETYRAELVGTGREFSGFCPCPAYSDSELGFCRHLVATALIANAEGGAALAESETRFARIRAHLRAQGVEALIERVVALAANDRALLEALELEATVDPTDDADVVARFEEALAAATSTGDYISYEEALDWAEGIASLLDRIDLLIDCGRAALALRLLDDLLARIEAALEAVDDSDGEAGSVVERACAMHLKACAAAKPDPVELARDLFTRGLESDAGAFADAGVTYAGVLGEKGGAEYRRLVRTAWDKIKPLHGGRRAEILGADDEFDRRYRLAAMLDVLAVQDGDIETRVAIRAKDLSAPHRYLDIAQLCLSHGREPDAVKWVEQGLRQFDDQLDAGLIAFAADLYRRVGRQQEAEALLWRQFEHDPSRRCYDQLRAGAGTDAGAAASVADRAVACLEARLAAEPAKRPPAGWMTTSHADLLVDVLVSDRRIDAAWQAARKHPCHDRTVRALAEASEDSHPVQALGAYAELVERELRLVAQPAYERACALIGRMATIRRRRGEDAAHAAYLAEVSARHKAKRNFMKLLRTQNLGAAAKA